MQAELAPGISFIRKAGFRRIGCHVAQKPHEIRKYSPRALFQLSRHSTEQQAVYANRRRVRASTARVDCGGAASSWNAASRIIMRRAGCVAATYVDGRTFSTGASMWAHSTGV